MTESIISRLRYAAPRAGVHFAVSLLVAACAALLVFGVWFPFPYREMAGGRELFTLIVSVDVVCGPLLTLILLAPKKSLFEKKVDVSLVAIIQLVALLFGLWTVWQARPLFLVAEIDRFKVIYGPQLEKRSLEQLPVNLTPKFLSGPVIVGIRLPFSNQEREKVLFESIQGGQDYAERPEFYIPYSGVALEKPLQRSKDLSVFIEKHPESLKKAEIIAKEAKLPLLSLRYLPVIARQDWIAVIDKNAKILGFLKGDGF